MAEEPQAETTPVKPGGSKKLQLLVVALLMLGEGAIVFFVANAMNDSPAVGEAAEGAGTDGADGGVATADFGEVEVCDCRPSNRSSGKFLTFKMRVSALVAADALDSAKEAIASRKSRILDRVNYVVRSADLAHLNEPGLETIKRRLKRELDLILGDDELIKEILIPELLQSGSGI